MNSQALPLNSVTEPKPGWWESFGRAQVANLITSAVDYGTLFTLTEVFKVYYVHSRAISAIMGAITNFTLGRYWSFKAADKKSGPQLFRYAIVSAGSLFLNVWGLYIITEKFHIKYGYSAVATSLLVSVFYNFPLQRIFVFKRGSDEKKSVPA